VIADRVVQRHPDKLLGAAIQVIDHASARAVDSECVEDVVAAHDGELGFGRSDFAEAHIAAVSGVELRLDMRVCEKHKIERAWCGRRADPEGRQGSRSACGGQSLQEFSAIQLHLRFLAPFCEREMLARQSS